MSEFQVELPLSSIYDKVIDLNKEFPGFSKYEVEIGTCSGLFLSRYANINKNVFFLGIEKKLKYFNRAAKNIRMFAKQDNIRIVNFDAIPLISEIIADISLDALHIYFPDPWPKKKHNQRRIVNETNLRMFHKKLKPSGLLYLATDHPEYAEFMTKEIAKLVDIFKKIPYSREDRKVLTKWEEKQIKKGFDINYFLLEKI